MPIAVTCPKCFHIGDVPDNYAGMFVRCPQCKAKMPVPNVPPPSRPAAAPPGVFPPASTGNANFAFDSDADQSGLLTSGPAITRLGHSFGEPWYYKYCHLATVFLMFVSVAAILLLFLGFLLVMVLGAAGSKRPEETLPGFLTLGVFQFVVYGIILLIVLYQFSFVLIFIDAARHVRKIYSLLSNRRG